MIKTAFCLLIGQNGPTAYSNWCFHAITNTEVKFIDNFLVLICNIWDGWQQKTRIQVSFCAILYFWNWHQLSWSQSHYLRHFLLLKLALISNIRQFRDCLFSSTQKYFGLITQKMYRSYGTFTFGLIWTCRCSWTLLCRKPNILANKLNWSHTWTPDRQTFIWLSGISSHSYGARIQQLRHRHWRRSSVPLQITLFEKV